MKFAPRPALIRCEDLGDRESEARQQRRRQRRVGVELLANVEVGRPGGRAAEDEHNVGGGIDEPAALISHAPSA